MANGSGERKSSTDALQVKNKDGILIPYGETRDYENTYGYHIDSAEFLLLRNLVFQSDLPEDLARCYLRGGGFRRQKTL